MALNVLIGMILVLGIMILVHEWGHFMAARFFGVRVDVFSIGFGPRLFGFKRGTTDYRLSALPLGGYVRMAGQDLSEVDAGTAAPTGAADELMSKPRWQRAIISFAGPAVNLIMPVLLMGGFFLVKGFPYHSYYKQPVVVLDMAPASPLAKSGISTGDRLAEVNGIANPTWGDLENIFEHATPADSMHLVFQGSQGQVKPVDLNLAEIEHSEAAPFGNPPNVPLIGKVEAGSPAERGGMKAKDVVVAVDGLPIANWPQMVEVIKKSEGKPLDVTVRRNGLPAHLSIQPHQGKNERNEMAWMIGVRPTEEFLFRPVGKVESFVLASQLTVKGGEQLLGVLGKLFTGRLSVKQLQGVIGISQRAGEAVQEGTFAIISLMAVISLNLGVLNLLPIPILDGGHILLLTIEGIRRRDLSLAFKERFVQVGLVFLLVLFAYVMYNDVVRLLPGHS